MGFSVTTMKMWMLPLEVYDQRGPLKGINMDQRPTVGYSENPTVGCWSVKSSGPLFDVPLPRLRDPFCKDKRKRKRKLKDKEKEKEKECLFVVWGYFLNRWVSLRYR